MGVWDPTARTVIVTGDAATTALLRAREDVRMIRPSAERKSRDPQRHVQLVW